TESEKFAGALSSLCIEAMMQDGKALQAGTSHDLGQNFGKAFDVKFQDKEGQQQYVWQTSWGVSTRLVGGLIMTPSDDFGLVLPPKLAPVHVAIVPIMGKDAAAAAKVMEAGEAIKKEIESYGYTAVFDTRDYKPGYKYFEWEQKGVPLRLELGPRDIENNCVMVKSRVEKDKSTLSRSGLGEQIDGQLKALQIHLLERAKKFRADNTLQVENYADFKDVFADNGSKFVMAHWDGSKEVE